MTPAGAGAPPTVEVASPGPSPGGAPGSAGAAPIPASLALQKKLAAAADTALARLFPRFGEGDADLRAWGAAVRRALEIAAKARAPRAPAGRATGAARSSGR